MAKLIYLTSLKYPATIAHALQTYKMAEQFSNLLENNFSFVISKDYGDNFLNINVTETECEHYKKFHLTTSFYFLWLTGYILRQKKIGLKETTFYLKDQKLAVLLLFMRRLFKFKYKVAFEYHGLYKDAIDKIICRNADFLIPLTSGLKEELLLKYKADQNKFYVAPDGVNISEFDIVNDKNYYRSELGLKADKKLVGYVGTVQTHGLEKGITEIFKSAKLLGDDTLFYIIGLKKADLDHYHSLVSDLNLTHKVILVEYQPPDLIPKYLKSFDVLLMPFPNKPHFAKFMSPLKLFEYMASKRPFIATDLPSIREIVSEKECVLVEPGNVESLAQAIKTLFDNEQAAIQFANNAFNKAHDYTWSRRAQNILDFIYER